MQGLIIGSHIDATPRATYYALPKESCTKYHIIIIDTVNVALIDLIRFMV